MRKLRHLVIVTSVVAPLTLVATLAGCSSPATTDAAPSSRETASPPPNASHPAAAEEVDDETATWLSEQPGVLSARAERRADRGALDIYVELDPDVPDEALISLTDEVSARLPGSVAPEGDSAVWYTLDEKREFSSLGGAFTLDFLFRWRVARACTISARGGGPETGDRFLVICPNEQEGWLTNFLGRHANAFGSTEGLAPPGPEVRFVTQSTDGRFVAESTATTDLSISSNFAFTVKSPVDIRSAHAVNDGTHESLLVVVGDEATKERVEQAYAEYRYDALELTVEVAP